MTDRIDKATRSRVMASVTSKQNRSTELVMMKILKRNHITAWRRSTQILGRPDFVWLDKKVALFVDGCFWHGCPNCLRLPSSNRRYWREKILGNVRRDKRVNRKLRNMGWKVLRIRECRLSSSTSVRAIQTTISRPNRHGTDKGLAQRTGKAQT